MRIIPYIKFLFTSTNAHGVHSPFVFDLVQKVFYADNPLLKGKYSKSEQLLFRTVHHFNPELIYINDVELKELAILQSAAAVTQKIQHKTHLAYLSYKEKAAIQNKFEQLLPTINNNTILIIKHIHASPDMEKAWIIIKNHHSVTVSIDTYKWGFVFFRNEQQKEHFVIRTSKSKLTDFILGIPKLWGMLH